MIENRRATCIISILASLSLLVLSAPPSPAQQETGSVLIGTVYSFTPKAIQGTVDISVHLPEGYESSGTAYPVLYLFDIEKDFVFASAVADFLAANDRIPPLIVVDIKVSDASEAPPQVLAFLEDELFSFVALNFRTQPCRVLYGHSGRVDDAMKIFSYLCAAEPADPAGFNSLGEAYEKLGQPELALKSFAEAVRLAQAANDPALKKYQADLGRLKKVTK